MWMTVVGTLGILFLPLIVSGLIDDLAFTKQQAGYVAAAEMAGVAILSGSGVFGCVGLIGLMLLLWRHCCSLPQTFFLR